MFAGEPLPNEGIDPIKTLQVAQLVKAENWYLFNPGSPLFMCWQSGFIRWLEAWQPDALIVEANPRYPVTRKAIQWMHEKGRKVIGWGLGAPEITGPFAGLRQRQRSDLLKDLDAIIAYSRQGAEQYRELGVAPERVYVAPQCGRPCPDHPATGKAHLQ